MPVKVTVTKTLEDWWATDEQLSEMTDQEIIDLIYEDQGAFLEDADWKIERPQLEPAREREGEK